MKYLKTYESYNDATGSYIKQETIDSINDILLDLKDEHSEVRLRCWVKHQEPEYNDGPLITFYDWKDFDELVSCQSISFEIKPANTFPVPGVYSKKRSYHLSKDEVHDMVETIKRVYDYLKNSDQKLNIHIHYEEREREKMTLGYQQGIDIKDIDKLLTDYSFMREDGTDKDFLYYISMTVNTNLV